MKTTVCMAILLVVSPVFADSFTAVCDADGVHAYRHDLNMAGDDMGANWSTGEKFPGKFRFSFDGENLEIDGKQAAVLYWNGIVLVAMDGGTTDSAASIWTYAINLDLEEVVGAQVNAFRNIGTGVKARAMNFKCEFSY